MVTERYRLFESQSLSCLSVCANIKNLKIASASGTSPRKGLFSIDIAINLKISCYALASDIEQFVYFKRSNIPRFLAPSYSSKWIIISMLL